MSSPSGRKTSILLVLIIIAAGVALWLLARRGAGPDVPGPPPEPPPWTAGIFQVDILFGPNRLEVSGQADLPEGEVIPLEMVFSDPGGTPFGSAETPVKDGRISAAFGPYDAPLPAGPYILRVRPGAGEPIIVAEESLDDTAVAGQIQAMRIHFLRFALETREIVEDLAATAEEGRFVDSRGAFLRDEWQTWMDEEFQGALGLLGAWHEDHVGLHAVDRAPEATSVAAAILDQLPGLAQTVSRAVHERHGLTPPPGLGEYASPEEVGELIDALTVAASLQDLSAPEEDGEETVEVGEIRATLKRRGRSHVLRVEGTLAVPDDAEYSVELRYHRPGNNIIASRRARGGRYRLRLTSPDRPIPGGTYLVRIIQYDDPQGTDRTLEFRIGEAGLAAEEEARTSHYKRLLQDLATLFWEAHQTLEEVASQEAFTMQGGRLDLPALTAWSKRYGERWSALAGRHETFRSGTVAPKYELENRKIAELLTLIRDAKDNGLRAVTGRVISEPFEVPIYQKNLNDLLRKEICPGLGLPAVTLSSLRLGEARHLEGQGKKDEALRIYIGLARRTVREKAVEAMAHLAAALIYNGKGDEWLAFPHLEILSTSDRYSKSGARRTADRTLEGWKKETSPWPVEKQAACRDAILGALEEVADRVRGGRFVAARLRLDRGMALQRGYETCFRQRIPDLDIRKELDSILSAVRSVTKALDGAEAALSEGRIDEYIPIPSEDLAGVADDSIRGWFRTRSEAAAAEAERIRGLRAALEDAGVQPVRAATGKRMVYFRVPGEEEPVPRAWGEEIREGIRLARTRGRGDGTVVILQMPDGDRFPYFIPDE